MYYHCSKKIDPNCPEPYVNELDLIDKFIQFVEFIEMKKIDFLTISNEVKIKTKKYKAFRDQILLQQNVSIGEKPLKFSEYFKHVIQSGSEEEKQELLKCIQQPLYLHNGDIFANPLIA